MSMDLFHGNRNPFLFVFPLGAPVGKGVSEHSRRDIWQVNIKIYQILTTFKYSSFLLK